MERAKQKESLLDLPDEEALSPEHLDSQVQRAQEQLLQLKRQQEQLEKQKRELEELGRRQEQLQQGRTEMIELFTRSLVVLERETYEAQKRVEQLKSMHESFRQHLEMLEGINPKDWDPADINKELNKALSAVDDARAEYTQSRPKINVEAQEEVLGPEMPVEQYGTSYRGGGEKDFVYWLKSGFAFTLPLLLVGVALFFVLLAYLANP